MPEWLVEQGIGETRAALVDDGTIIEARIELDGTIAAGTILEARLIDSTRRIARTEDGTDYLLRHLPKGIGEGTSLSIEVTRPAIPGPEPWKRPLAKAALDAGPAPQSLAERLGSTGHPVRFLTLPAAVDALAEAGWNDIVEEARSHHVEFAGGSLGLFATPAMTLIDVDGSLAPADLAIAGARAAAIAIRRLDIGGSIGIDLPTVQGKSIRTEAAQAVDEILCQPFERTAVNGFGFLQIVRPRPRASLLELAQDRAAFEARALLRRSAFDGGGKKRLVACPAVIAILEANPGWIDALSCQVGGEVALRSDPSLPIQGSYAEKG